MAIAEVIKYEGPKEALVWKNSGKEYLISGNEKFNALSQLIVDEFYEAILFANGRALDLFKPGRYTLTTQNIPLLSKAYEGLLDGSPFPCKVYYVYKKNLLELKWGTQGGITLNDPIYDIFLHVGCCGTMGVKISDSRKFLLKFVGNNDVFENSDLLHNLRGIISSNVKNFISKIMIQGKVSFFDMNAHIYDLGNLVAKVLSGIFESYGLSIEHFNIETIDVPKEDYDLINKAKSLSTSRKIQGFTWQEEQMYKILDDAAKNEGTSSTFMGAGMGLGMGIGMGNTMGNAFSSISNNVFNNQSSQSPFSSGSVVQNPNQNNISNSNGNENLNVNDFFKQKSNNEETKLGFCCNCGAQLPANAVFCPSCGTKQHKDVCSNCGKEVTVGALFCSNCGNKLK